MRITDACRTVCCYHAAGRGKPRIATVATVSVSTVMLCVVLLLTAACAGVPDYMDAEGWKLRYCGEFPPDAVETGARLGRRMGAGKLYSLMYREPGEWWNFGFQMPKELTVSWGPESKVILITTTDPEEKVISEACLFTESELQTRLWDSRQGPVYLGGQNKEVCHKENKKTGVIAFPVFVKFPLGSVTQREVKAVMVEGVNVISRHAP